MAFIDAKEVKIQALLSNAQEAYKVPLYQRPYAWRRDQWEDLFNDMSNLSQNDVHFFGSIVVVPEGEHRLGVNYFNVVDGQQRLATILIWLAVIRDLAQESENTELAKHITGTFLFAKDWQSGREVKIPKLQLGRLDNDAFLRVIKGEPKNESYLIFECYDFLKRATEVAELWQKLVNNISIVHINAFNYFNAFRLFETLNDRGLELSAADLIKNLFLMRVSEKEDVFEQVISDWNEMYEKVRDKEPVKFIRRYILASYKGKVSEARLYERVRKQHEKTTFTEIFNFVSDLNQKATIYKKIHDATFTPAINDVLQQLHLVEVAPSYTLLLKVLPYFENEKILEDEIFQIMKMIEVFHIRWGICGQSTSSLDQIYNDICMRLSEVRPEQFVKYIKEELTKRIKDNVDDEIFKRNFMARPFKPTESRTKHILWRLSKPTGETTINIKEIQTEHIIPQRLSNGWIDYLINKTSKEKKEILALHQENINKIGNFTIIKGTWNQSMSNRLFDKKKKDYEKSEFGITNDLKNYDIWTFDQINSRCETLANTALEIWKWE